MAENWLEGVFVIGLLMGVRRGELLGLRWPDVDLEKRRLHVRQTLQRAGGSLQVVEPKTHRSRRIVRIPAIAVPAFERQPPARPPSLAAGQDWQDDPADDGHVHPRPGRPARGCRGRHGPRPGRSVGSQVARARREGSK